MKLTQDQKNALLAKLELIDNDRLCLERDVEGGEIDPLFMSEVADQIVDWATQLSELLYEMEVEDERGAD